MSLLALYPVGQSLAAYTALTSPGTSFSESGLKTTTTQVAQILLTENDLTGLGKDDMRRAKHLLPYQVHPWLFSKDEKQFLARLTRAKNATNTATDEEALAA